MEVRKLLLSCGPKPTQHTMTKYKVGDRVRALINGGYESEACVAGDLGTVMQIIDGSARVCFDGRAIGPWLMYDYEIELVEALPPSLEDRIAALEARLAAIEGHKEEVKEEAPQYTFGQPVEVRVDGEWREGVIFSAKAWGGAYWVAYLEAASSLGAAEEWFTPEDIRPRTA